MLRDDMGMLKKELQATRAQVGDAVAITDKIDTRFHMLESEMRGMWKQIKDSEAARSDTAAIKAAPAASQVTPCSCFRCGCLLH